MADVTGSDNDGRTTTLLSNFFPVLSDDKIHTVGFLEASRGVVALIDKFGGVFSPLSYDISGNINKLQISYDRNPNKYTFIEDLILCEKRENEIAVDALLWLQRALHFVLIFFKNILDDNEKNESLQKHMTNAYAKALEPYHGWFSRNLFRFFRGMVPKRSALLSAIGDAGEEQEVIRQLEIYVKHLEISVTHIMRFYMECNLATESKVP